MSSDTQEYASLLSSIRNDIQVAQKSVASYANSNLLYTYWQIGNRLNAEIERQKWGAKVVDRLSSDLKLSFPNMKGLSKRNFGYMQKFATQWPVHLILQQGVAKFQQTDNEENSVPQHPAARLQNFEENSISKVPWSHHVVLLDKIDGSKTRLFYIEKILSNNWSRKILLNQIERKLHLQIGTLSNNFNATLPAEHAGLVQATFKDPYFFDFLQLSEEASERDLEDKLIKKIEHFLLELGAGFAYLGRQHKLTVGPKDYYLDLLFFHTQLNCFINIELKIDEFKPEYVGKSQFYLSAINDLLKKEFHNPSIGILLCKEADSITVEYSLKQSNLPIGVAQYQLTNDLPDELSGLIPSASDFMRTLEG